MDQGCYFSSSQHAYTNAEAFMQCARVITRIAMLPICSYRSYWRLSQHQLQVLVMSSFSLSSLALCNRADHTVQGMK